MTSDAVPIIGSILICAFLLIFVFATMGNYKDAKDEGEFTE